MRKILFGFLGIMMVVAVVAGTARALYSTTATVGGITFASGNADIKVSDGGDWKDNISNSVFDFANMYPGYGVNPNITKDFYIKNSSSSNIGLDLKAQLTGVPATWGNQLSYAIQLGFVNADDLSQTTGWVSLMQWQAGARTLPGGSLAQTGERHYKVYVRIPYNYGDDDTGYAPGWYVAGVVVGNEISGQTLNGLTFTFTGTQTVTL